MANTNRMQRAIDFIDERLTERLTLDEIACAVHLSSYHFARWFRSQTGYMVMGYVRARRLAVAVHTLRQDSETPLLDLALAVGFESQPGFTNAFKRAFGLPPAAYRARPFALPALQEKITMTDSTERRPRGPEFRTRDAFRVAGFALDCNLETRSQIPALWARFAPNIDRVPHKNTMETYGVCVPTDKQDGSFTYLAAVGVSDPDVGDDFTSIEVPETEYAVFTHEGSLDHLHQTVDYIFGTWLPASEYELTGTPDFELYDNRFDPLTGTGELEYWIPIRKPANG